MMLREREGEGRDVQAEEDLSDLTVLGVYNPPLTISLHLEFAL